MPHFVTAPLRPVHSRVKSPRVLLGILLLGMVLLSACGGGIQESWAGVSHAPDDSAVYVAYEKKVVAITPTDGAVQWTYSGDNARFYAVPTVTDDVVYVGDYEGRMHAIDRTTGQALWVYQHDRKALIGPLSLESKDRVIGGATVDSSLVYFGLGSRNLIAVSRDTGTEVWTMNTNHGVWATPLYLPANPDDPNSHAMLYFPSLDHHLYAVNAETGEKLWSTNLSGAAPGNLVYDAARNRVYVGTFASEVLAVDLATGNIVARFTTDEWIWGSPTLQDDVLYFGDLTGQLYAVQVTDTDFKLLWKQKVAGGAIRSAPLVVNDTIVVSSKDKHVYAVQKADGTALWNAKTKGEALTNLAFVPGDPQAETQDMVVAGTEAKDQLLIAFTLASGDEVWHYNAK